MRLPTGFRLGRYEIVAPLDAGGMGEVYRARDLTLKRDVAVKVLLEEFATDADRLKRFEREAMATAALNHPNILAIHDVGTLDGVTYVVSEFLEGRTLRELLVGGPLAPRKAMRFAAQIADGLGAAHAKGIVHRDVKPANVFVTTDERIKILDFGLARVVEGSPLSDSPSAATTAALTTPGTVLGSAGYMAPEQVRGMAADHRADIFSLGVVLYEMLSGQRAFRRDTIAGTLAAIVESDPPSWTGDGSAIVQRIMRLVRRCLEKSPHDRFQSARDLSLVLADESSDVTPAPDRPHATARSSWRVWVAAGVVGAVLGAGLWAQVGTMAQRGGNPVKVTFEIPLPEGVQWDSLAHPVISNDGGRIAFHAVKGGKRSIFVRRLSELQARELPGTLGATMPFFSPDASRLAFFADGLLKTIEIDTGALLTVCEAPSPRGGTWTDDNEIVFAGETYSALSRVNANGGTPTLVTTLGPGEVSHRFPHALPGRDGVVFNIQLSSGGGRIAAVDPKTQQHAAVVERGNAPQFGGGRLFYLNDHREWMAVPFDPTTRTVIAAAQPQVEHVGGGAYIGDSGFSVSRNGTVVYLPYEATLRSLAVVSRDGRVEPVPGPPRQFDAFRLSPDGTRIAASVLTATGDWGDIWIGDLKGNFVPFTNDGVSRYPIWSPRADRIALVSRRSGLPTVFGQPVLAGPAVQFTDGTNETTPASWLPDGTTLLVSISDSRRGSNSSATVAEGRLTPSPVSLAVKSTTYTRMSPDGRWLAYTNADSGQWEVYVTTFPVSGRVWQVSEAKTGREPMWSPLGDQLYFRRADGRLVAVPVTSNGPAASGLRNINVEAAAMLLEPGTPGIPRYDVFPDGRILIQRPESDRQRMRPLVVKSQF